MRLIPRGALELGQPLGSSGCPEWGPGDQTWSSGRWISHLMGTALGRGARVAHGGAQRGAQRPQPRRGASPAGGRPPQDPVQGGGCRTFSIPGASRPALSALRLCPALVRATRGDPQRTNLYLAVAGLTAQCGEHTRPALAGGHGGWKSVHTMWCPGEATWEVTGGTDSGTAVRVRARGARLTDAVRIVSGRGSGAAPTPHTGRSSEDQPARGMGWADGRGPCGAAEATPGGGRGRSNGLAGGPSGFCGDLRACSRIVEEVWTHRGGMPRWAPRRRGPCESARGPGRVEPASRWTWRWL